MLSRRRLVKLVRDRVGEFLPDTRVHYEPVERDRHIALLRRKLVEEAVEYLLDPSIEELADVLEVVTALAGHDLNITLQALERERVEKACALGRFDAGLAMYAVSSGANRHHGLEQ